MESKMRIAVCDDEQAIADLVAQLLVEAGFSPAVFYAAPDLLAQQGIDPFDLVVLDIMMPGMDGFACCRELRRTSSVPIIFLTAKDEEIDKVVGFELGADDYVVKPFKPRELVARVRARLRRSASPARATAPTGAQLLEARGVALDEGAYAATLHGEPLALTPKEFAILACLLRDGRPSGGVARSVRGGVGRGGERPVQQHGHGAHTPPAQEAGRHRLLPGVRRDGVGRGLQAGLTATTPPGRPAAGAADEREGTPDGRERIQPGEASIRRGGSRTPSCAAPS